MWKTEDAESGLALGAANAKPNICGHNLCCQFRIPKPDLWDPTPKPHRHYKITFI
jgi:hypothetical protein